ncbi:hypothetical protein CDD83_2392 [Cordyceps sp. RAO-2017]|nr:hypothetical protein CDD83_2392 [Cordyceps sp. RAO-2017]
MCARVCDPRYVSVCVEMAQHLLDLYADAAAAEPALHEALRTLHRRVRLEVERAQLASQTGGMLESLVRGAAA